MKLLPFLKAHPLVIWFAIVLSINTFIDLIDLRLKDQIRHLINIK